MTPPIAIDKDEVARSDARLLTARRALKDHFIGIDGIIDELCDAIRLWYVAPQVLRRPVIVNLWGMTGVGKTDLVRRLATELGILDRFVELELTNGDTTTWHSSVASMLGESGALEGQPTLLLFDEIQRFNTLDHMGNPVQNTKFSDFWELLSDGQLSRRESPEISYLIASLAETERSLAAQRAEGTKVDDRLGVWRAQEFKRATRSTVPLETIAEMTTQAAVESLRSVRLSQEIYKPIDCTRCLIVISGNLDEAFTMAGEGAEADIDADVFAAHTARITVVDIKNALQRRFKPEQVARFGNTHLIYSSLGRANFEELIDREVAKVVTATKEAFGITVVVDVSVRDLIYRNGVFPVQGVRPVLSSVSDILETNLAPFILEALISGKRTISFSYDVAKRELVVRVGKTRTTLPFTGRLDRIRESSSLDKVANVAVHESGHALAHVLLFGLAPIQLTAKVASAYAAGFTFAHTMHATEASLIAQTMVMLAGGVAEEIVFGKEWASVGRAADREKATRTIIDFVRRYGFDREFQADYMLADEYAMDRSVPEPDIEKMLTRLVAETRQLLIAHEGPLRALARALSREGRMGGEAIAAVLREFDLEVQVRPESHQVIPEYAAALEAGPSEAGPLPGIPSAS